MQACVRIPLLPFIDIQIFFMFSHFLLYWFPMTPNIAPIRTFPFPIDTRNRFSG